MTNGQGYVLEDVREAPDRPGLEYVCVAHSGGVVGTGVGGVVGGGAGIAWGVRRTRTRRG
ncbi:hypothetical protein ACIQZN_24845 [Streptomyces sp. NPDC097595]|uniref:hypothetical protein n=1 Tax=Streptomyces sp. NPDC097595 TaxID=3366090 RepID=UPI0038296B40